MNRNYFLAFALALVMAGFPVAHAGSMSCGDVFITTGVSQEYVLEQCGEPALTQENKWYYSPPGSITTVITFGGGLVNSIDTGELPGPGDTEPLIGDQP